MSSTLRGRRQHPGRAVRAARLPRRICGEPAKAHCLRADDSSDAVLGSPTDCGGNDRIAEALLLFEQPCPEMPDGPEDGSCRARQPFTRAGDAMSMYVVMHGAARLRGRWCRTDAEAGCCQPPKHCKICSLS